MSDRQDPIPDHLVDAFFDGELAGEERRAFLSAARSDLKQCEDLARTQRMLSMLRGEGASESPDFTASILDRVHERRRFIPSSVRRLVNAGRVAVAASVLAGLSAIVLIQRYAPEATRLAPEPRYISGVVESGRQEAASGAQTLASAIGAFKEQITAPMALVPLEDLRAGDRGGSQGSGAVAKGGDPVLVFLSIGDAGRMLETVSKGIDPSTIVLRGGSAPFGADGQRPVPVTYIARVAPGEATPCVAYPLGRVFHPRAGDAGARPFDPPQAARAPIRTWGVGMSLPFVNPDDFERWLEGQHEAYEPPTP